MPEFSTVLLFLFQSAIGLIGLSLLVFIHEGGHFLVAKKMGVRVNTFSIGFGKTLFSITRGGTEYCIKAIPFGGYVAMAGEQPDGTTAAPDDFASKSVPARMAIAIAGPAVNIAFSFLVLVVLFMAGVEEPIVNEFQVGKIEKDSPGEKADLQKGDVVYAINGEHFQGVNAFYQKVAIGVDDKLILNVLRGEDSLDVPVTPVLTDLGIGEIGVRPNMEIRVRELSPGWPAEAAGFRKDDAILSVDGLPIYDWDTFVGTIKNSDGKTLNVSVLRDSAEKQLQVTPRFSEEVDGYQIGLAPYIYNLQTRLVKRSFTGSLQKSFEKNVEYSTLIFVTLQKLLRGKIPLKSLSGPLGIVQVIGNTFRHSVRRFVEFLAMISLNLGIFNLLPLIITDGGMILFLALEAVRKKPLDVRTQLRINQIAVSFFIALALFITFHDILKTPTFLN